MPDLVRLHKVNETYIQVKADPGIVFELADHFTFDVPGAKHTPKFKLGVWDGKIRLLNKVTGAIYAGLADEIVKLCEDRGYEVECDWSRSANEFSVVEAEKFVATLGLPEDRAPRDYQLDVLITAARYGRHVFLSPTASGKSLIIYLLAMYFQKKVLVIVPTTHLVHQMVKDFGDYGFDPAGIHKIYAGQPKETRAPIVVTTWQSIGGASSEWLEKYGVIVADECHLFTAKTLKEIMERATHCALRFGFSGTLDGTKTHELVLKGLFGPIRKVANTTDLIEQGYLAKLNIKAIKLEYDQTVRDFIGKGRDGKPVEYKTEADFLITHEPRNRFIKNMTLGLKGNSLVLFSRIEHGETLWKMISSAAGDRKVFLIYGKVEGTERARIQQVVEGEEDAVVVASYQTFGTGTNVINLNNVVFASPNKGRIRNLQSIGRGLRKAGAKTDCTLIDIGDDMCLRSKKSGKVVYQNHTLRHFAIRINTYAEEAFPYRIYPIELKGV